MCDCGKRIESTIKTIKEEEEMLRYCNEKIKQGNEVDIWKEYKELTRWFINIFKKYRRFIEINHRYDCKGESHLINEMPDVI